jgi:hypothetical protein
VRAGRARPQAARLGLLGWLAVTALLVAFGPRGFAPLLAVAGIYLLGPLWIPVRYRVDDRGVERSTAFGRRLWAWGEIGAWGIDPVRRSAWLSPRGRGTARFLPPVLLLWEEGEDGGGFAARLEAWLEGRVAGPTGTAKAGP